MLLSLALVGVLIGLMIGRLTNPGPAALLQVDAQPERLMLWFSERPELHGEIVDGTVAMVFQAEGTSDQGQLSVAGKPVRWRLQRSEQGLLLTLIASRPLQGEWHVQQEKGRWRVEVELRQTVVE